ncbi:hypothetical protein P691DRAFT_767926 [Macrolepiota fuliginosa MF-IS2]|uniref:Transmembrane protein n=1 Tax=Macrolepiota fuliginosa MF-IS2 TaxID=1400762 RepID=A0A9P6BW95_9AGAR|nr:hypothetical protein P691DRAFT_767926 [Macrolepiota fuliginosa MF-IS2]
MNTNNLVHIPNSADTFASILFCDTQITIQRAQVVLSNGTLQATNFSNSSPFGNMEVDLVMDLFYQIHQILLGPSGVSGSFTYRQLAGTVFLDILSLQFDGRWALSALLSLSDINHNLAWVIQSTAKAVYSNGCLANYNLTASRQFQQTSLISSKQFTIALGVLDVIMVIVLMILVYIVNTTDMQLFSLQALEGIYHKELPLQSE